MKVLHISSEKGWRGGERQVILLLQELITKGIHCVLLCPLRSKLYEVAKEENLTARPFNIGNPFNLRAAFELKRIASREKFDLIHVHSSKAHTLGLLSAQIGLKTPLILTKRTTFKIKRNLLTLYKYNHPSLKAIIAISEKIKYQLEEAIKEKRKIKVIPSGVDLCHYRTESSQLLHHFLGLPEKITLIGIVAALSPEKDHFTFIKTAKILLERHPNLHFVIIGKGPLEASLGKYIMETGHSNNIHMVGHREDIYCILPELKVMMLTSVVEGLGSVILDAFGSEVPVVATKAGGIPELVKHLETGMLAETKDACGLAKQVEILLSNPLLRNNIIQNASQFVKNFTISKMAESTLNIYREVLSD